MYKNIFLAIIILVVIIILIICFKNILLYNPTKITKEKYQKFYNKLEKLTETKKYVANFMVKTDENKYLDTIYLKNPDSAKCIIFFHGNAGNITSRFNKIKFLYNYTSIVIFDYSSFGRSSTDSLSSRVLHRDALAVWNFTTKNLAYNPSQVSLFGESLGCSVAIHLTYNLSKQLNEVNYPHSLILTSPFSSLSSMIQATSDKIQLRFLGQILSFFLGREYESDEWIKFVNHKTKIIISHSPMDEVIPFDESQKLYNLVKEVHPFCKFITINGTHNNQELNDTYYYALADLFDDDICNSHFTDNFIDSVKKN